MRPLGEASPGTAPARQRSEGTVRLTVARYGGATRVAGLAEAGPLRLRLPRGEGTALEGVLLNTAGGIACGDRFRVDVIAGPGTTALLTTAAAEKIYRSDGPITQLATRLVARDGADLTWLPQETILFDGVRLARTLEVDMDAEARVTLFEATVFGRIARSERIAQGRFCDAWRVRRGGRLAYADTLRAEGGLSDLLDRPALGGGNAALATLLHLAPDAEARLEQTRALIAALPSQLPGEVGASAWNGHLVVRFLAPTVGALRAAATRVIAGFRGAPMPRVWQT